MNQRRVAAAEQPHPQQWHKVHRVPLLVLWPDMGARKPGREPAHHYADTVAA